MNLFCLGDLFHLRWLVMLAIGIEAFCVNPPVTPLLDRFCCIPQTSPVTSLLRGHPYQHQVPRERHQILSAQVTSNNRQYYCITLINLSNFLEPSDSGLISSDSGQKSSYSGQTPAILDDLSRLFYIYLLL